MIEIVLLTIIRSLIAGLGLLVSYKSYKIAKETPYDRLPYYLLASGFLVLTIGVTLEGILYEVFHIDLIVVHSVEALITSSGLLLILLAIQRNRL